ncbi:MAG: hypothetical protein JSW71_01260 [Gemmatimonadota bacterium]|nr:MAG: hypothetical protein JSW71_01260 [Gemmatimonadota bacterium]
MKRRKLLLVVAFKILLLGTAFALVTILVGWWGAPALAAVWGLIAPNKKRAPLLAAVAAGWGCVLLLLWTAVLGPVLELADRAASVMGMRSASLVGMTVGFSMVLAWAAAVTAAAMRPGNKSD